MTSLKPCEIMKTYKYMCPVNLDIHNSKQKNNNAWLRQIGGAKMVFNGILTGCNLHKLITITKYAQKEKKTNNCTVNLQPMVSLQNDSIYFV